MNSLLEKPSATEPLALIEESVRGGAEGIIEARNQLRHWLLERAGSLEKPASIGNVLAELARAPTKDKASAIVVLRFLAVPGLLPEPNGANQIIRSVVTLCEHTLPEICSFLRIDKKAQNYEKFALWSATHNTVCDLLKPLTESYSDVDALIRGRKDMLGALNHSVVRLYGEPFRIHDVRNAIEGVFSRLKRVATPEATFLQDFEECRRSIENAKIVIRENGSFVARDFLASFLDNTERLLENYIESVRGRFHTKISRQSYGEILQKRYPLHEEGREVSISIPLTNLGPGIATDVRVTVLSVDESIYLSSHSLALGNLLPGEFSVVLDAMVVAPSHGFRMLMQVEWGELGSPARQSEVFELEVVSQASDIDWQSLAYWTPYSTDVADGADFIGRMDKVKLLASKFLRSPMEPFYVTGQKRVGKTSLALAAANFAVSNEPHGQVSYLYMLWGDVAHADPRASVRQIGEKIESFIREHLPPEVHVERGDYDGTLSPIVSLSDVALQFNPSKKFVIIVDEFDEIPQELYLHGNLADTFFANLRAISRRRNICLAFVGGENMSYIMTRQGQRLNNFSQVNLSYFSRESEWSDFQLMVKQPSDKILNWHEGALSEVFNITNGNPYYAKLVCAGVVRSAVAERDADVTAYEVKTAAEAETSALGSHSFAHLWQDGIPRAADEREPEILCRSRVLVAMARCLREAVPLTVSNIAERKTSASLSAAEISAVLSDFQKREVLKEQDGVYTFVLPIFRVWLADVGATQLVADSLSEELAYAVLAEENAATIRADEVVALAKSWQTFRGRQIGTDEIRAWYQQVPSVRDQRVLFELLRKVRFFTEAFIRERLRLAHSIIRSELPVFITKKRKERRKDIIVTYVDGPAKSGASYAALYAEENGIAAQCVLPPDAFAERFSKHLEEVETVNSVVIIDDIAATGSSLASNLTHFARDNAPLLASVTVRAVCLVATAEAQRKIEKVTGEIEDVDVRFRACEILDNTYFAFPDDKSGWGSVEKWERARALCVQLGTRVYKNNPLGYGGMGLLLVFPTTVPNNSLPILHSHSRTGSDMSWEPLFLRLVN